MATTMKQYGILLVSTMSCISFLISGCEALCSMHQDVDCNGYDLKMLHDFGINQTACCEMCEKFDGCTIAVLATSDGGVCMLKSACPTPAHSAERIACVPPNGPPLPPTPTPLPPSPVLVPKWTPTYNMSESTTIMPCNYSGLYDFEAYPELGRFGLVDYDWSNAKLQWDNQSPMNCESSLITQAAANKKQNPSAKVFVYRNIVKALPWYSEVRELLEDPQYWGFFLPYKPSLRHGTTAGGNLYHDHDQTPGWPGNGGPHDGVCHNHTGAGPGPCDCGVGIPCGEYLFDHRNATLRQWLVDTYIGGDKFGLGNVNVDGFYLDDHWSARGPSEEAHNCTELMGLSVQNITDITEAWSKNMRACQQAIVDKNGFNWQLFHGTSSPVGVAQCTSYLKEACSNTSFFHTSAVQYEISVNIGSGWKSPTQPGTPWTTPTFETDLATFLLARGDYAWLGYGWKGCGCGWDLSTTNRMDCGGYPRPPALDVDYGAPLGLCTETSAGVFEREWSKASVKMDCETGTSQITMKPTTPTI